MNLENGLTSFLNDFDYVIWDFDGVLKNSLPAKGRMFRKFFESLTGESQEWIEVDHLMNGGESRKPKLARYFRHLGLPISDTELDEICSSFSNEMISVVSECEGFPSNTEAIVNTSWSVAHYTVSASPEFELRKILKKIGLATHMRGINGAPREKKETVKNLAKKIRGKGLMVGDSIRDYEAAGEAGIMFLLNVHDYNKDLLGTLSRDRRCIFVGDTTCVFTETL